MTAARSEPITDSELAAIVEWEQTPCWNADGWRMSIVLERDNGHAKGAVVATTELRNAALAARELQALRAALRGLRMASDKFGWGPQANRPMFDLLNATCERCLPDGDSAG
jgi:hypothetical protein